MPSAPEETERAPRVRTQHVAAVSAAVFVAGAVGTVLYGVWRRPAWSVMGPVAAKQATHAAAAPPRPVDTDTPKSAWALFGEMNAAIFRRGTRVPNEPADRAPLSALSRRAPAVQPPSAQAAPLRALSRSGTGAMSEPAARIEDLDNDGALMAVRAFAVATALVGAGAACAALLLRATLGVRSLEELADYLHTKMPSVRPPESLERLLPVIPRDDTDSAPAEADVEQRLETTDDVAEWLRLARLQLDAELAAHAAEREQRMAARHYERGGSRGAVLDA
ncbi:hypothetical protein MCAP1_002677 [Malassezia caprae]|uniref:Transmembrane protein n=1 Tax=Malassezia caprae TaxID=1381934 RepID=A0AAF0EA42_9BASI|nr:hypothetical protein MCAP1_002677 [Malassezia caprae]